MTDTDLLELECPPDIIATCFPRFAEALARAVAELGRRCDGHAKLREELNVYKAQLAAVLDAADATTVDEVVERLNGGHHDAGTDGLHA